MRAGLLADINTTTTAAVVEALAMFSDNMYVCCVDDVPYLHSVGDAPAMIGIETCRKVSD